MSKVTILDGGMGGELIRRGISGVDGLWSAQALIEQPHMVRKVHLDYIAAGARIITTNTYSTIPSYLDKEGLAERYVELTAQAAQIARAAADESLDDVMVAGCLPPLSDSYRPDLVPPVAEAQPVYEAMVDAMVGSVDAFWCETMSSAVEAHTAATAAARQNLPVYVSWTLDENPGHGLRSGESVATAFAALKDLPIAGYLFNCTRPEAIIAGLAELKQLTDKPIGGYANRLDTIPPGWTLDNEVPVQMNRDLSTEVFVATGKRFVAEGATIVGGCCGIGPEDITAFVAAQQVA